MAKRKTAPKTYHQAVTAGLAAQAAEQHAALVAEANAAAKAAAKDTKS